MSTAAATATINVANTTAGEVGYNPMQVAFVIRDADGRTHEQSMITFISMTPRTSWIAPGEHQDFGVTLPGCEVHIDPCTMRVAVNIRLEVKPSGFASIVSNEVTYTFVADPTATFNVKGLRDNRPFFITHGEARDALPQDRGWIGFQFTGTVPQDLSKFVGTDAEHHDLIELEQGSNGPFQWFTLISKEQHSHAADVAAPSVAELSEIVGDVQKRYGDQVSKEPVSFVPDHDFGFDRVFAAGRDAARADAARIALFVDAGPVSDAFGDSEDGPQIQIVQRDFRDDNPPPFVPYGTFVFDPAEREREKSSWPGILDVYVHTMTGFAGLHATSGPASNLARDAIRSRYLGDGLGGLSPTTVRTTVAADRPEVYAVGTVAREDAGKAGIDPDALAITLASDRARELASQLGESSRLLSLVVHYNDITSPSGRTLASDGVALTIDDESRAAWHSLTAPTPSPSPRTARATTSYMIVMGPIPLRPGGAQSPAPDLVPIDVPDPASLLAVGAEVTTSPLADELRISVAFYIRQNISDKILKEVAPDPETVRSKLLALHGISDVAVQESNGIAFPIGYEFVARTIDLGRVASAINLLQSQYAMLNPTTKFNVALVSSNCVDELLRAQRESVRSAERDAMARAKSKGVKLRRLVLAAVYPPDTGDFCTTTALSDGLDRAGDDSLHPPPTKTLTIRVHVKLTFRTRPIHSTSTL